MINKNIIFGFLAGAALGAVGYKYYNENKDSINAKLNDLKIPGFNDLVKDVNVSEDDISLEELVAQKERLEDLIAEFEQKQAKNKEA